MHLRQIFFTATLLSFSLGLTACTVKAYPGPVRPEQELAEITIRSANDSNVQAVLIDGVNYPGLGNTYQVLPGTHVFEINYTIESDLPCYGHWYCFSEVDYGVCSGSIVTQIGRPYLITLNNQENTRYVSATVLAKSYTDFNIREDELSIGGASCRVTSTETKSNNSEYRDR